MSGRVRGGVGMEGGREWKGEGEEGVGRESEC